jgi:hypothetical protein
MSPAYLREHLYKASIQSTAEVQQLHIIKLHDLTLYMYTFIDHALPFKATKFTSDNNERSPFIAI